jgi:hypothetical protein
MSIYSFFYIFQSFSSPGGFGVPTVNMYRNIVIQLVLSAIAASPVLGQSFSLPFRKVQTNGQGKIHSTGRHHRGIAQIGEFDQDVTISPSRFSMKK